MPVTESTLGVVRVRVTDQSTGLPAWVTLNAAPPIANNVWEAADETAMLALTVKQFDLAIRLDRNALFYYLAPVPPAIGTPTLITDWKQVSWADAQLVANRAAMLALTTTDYGDLVYDSAASELYIRLEVGTGALITDWLKIGSRPNIHLDVADEAAMLLLVAEKGDLAIRLDQDATYALHTNPASVALNWVQLPGAGSAKDIWVYSAAATGAADPGLGNMTAESDGLTPPTWTFEVSAVDSTSNAHNLMILKDRDTVVLTNAPLNGAAPTFFQRFEVVGEPTDGTTYYTFTAVPIDVAVGTMPVVGDEVALDLGFGGGAIKVLDELDDVQTVGLLTHPAGPVAGEVLQYDPDGGGPGIPLWIPGTDTHIIHDYLVSSTEPTQPDGVTPVPDGSIWLSPAETAPIGGIVPPSLPLTGGTMYGPIMFQNGSKIEGKSPLLITRSTAGEQPQIADADGATALYNIVDTRPSTVTAATSWSPYFSGTANFRHNATTVTVYGTAIIEMAQPGAAPMFTYVPGVGYPGAKISALVWITADDNSVSFETAMIYTDPNGIYAAPFPGFTLVNFRKFDFSLTWAR